MIRLKLLPMGNIPDELLDAIVDELQLTLNVIASVSLPVALPKQSYNPIRHQFHAGAVLDFLLKKFEGRVLAITDKDLYAEELNFVFGQAQLGGNVAVVSIHRLDPTFYKHSADEKLLTERAVKEAVHEAAHMIFSMKHCDNSGCVMSFSNTIFGVDRKSKNFCDLCKSMISLY